MNNLDFKNFLKTVVLETTPEDEKDDTFFELKDWVDSEFIGIPSSEVQRYVDKNIPIWLESQETAETFVKNLCKIELKQLGIRSAAIAARHAVEKYWENTGNGKEPMAAVELVEKWLCDENSVCKDELRTAGNAAAHTAVSPANAAWAAANAAVYPANAVYAARAAANAAYAAAASSNREVCEIIREKLPKFNFEDLAQWKYFLG